MMLAVLFVACLTLTGGVAEPKGILVKPSAPENSDDFIEHINSVQSSWKAGHNERFVGVPPATLKGMLGTKFDIPVDLPTMVHTGVSQTPLPVLFDARQQWPQCPSISDIRDQGSCGSCWAFGAVEVFSDRLCISKGIHVNISAENLMACTDGLLNHGCHGGIPALAWVHMWDTGLVTGGQYNSSSGCQPYTIPSCEHHTSGHLAPCSSKIAETPACSLKCREGYDRLYADDIHKAESVYHVKPTVEQIMAEILTNGPVEAAFTVYSDFIAYKSGVYFYTDGHYLGGHAVRILGWGTENGVDYWLVANSWNTDWGMDGYFKIRRGTNECGIEHHIVAGKA